MPDVRTLWNATTPGARLLRAALLPAAAVFRGVSEARNALYAAGLLTTHDLGVPTASIGNLTVGGTGKTTIASWMATELARAGARPAILLRGYGGDEAAVHSHLSPSAIVLSDANRVRGARAAIARGADVLVLDDAFQHRRARRDADIVLVSADAVGGSDWPLPAGPWREPLAALRRASLALVTRKAAPDESVDRLLARIARAAPGTSVAVARIELGDLTGWGAPERLSAGMLSGERILAVSAIGDPAAFEEQLRQRGADVTPVRFPDHHRFSAGDVAALRDRSGGGVRAVCTLKDAVKLGPLWPLPGPPLWYLSQHVIIERGEGSLAGVLARLLASRRSDGPDPAPLP